MGPQRLGIWEGWKLNTPTQSKQRDLQILPQRELGKTVIINSPYSQSHKLCAQHSVKSILVGMHYYPHFISEDSRPREVKSVAQDPTVPQNQYENHILLIPDPQLETTVVICLCPGSYSIWAHQGQASIFLPFTEPNVVQDTQETFN